MTDDTLSRLRALHEAATPGRWERDDKRVLGGPRGDETASCTWSEAPCQNAALIAAMRNTLPALLAVAEAADRVVLADRAFNALEQFDDAGPACDEQDAAHEALDAALDALRKVTL